MDAQGVHRKWISMALREALFKLVALFGQKCKRHVKLNVIRLSLKAEVAASSESLEYTNYIETYHNIENYNIRNGKVLHP